MTIIPAVKGIKDKEETHSLKFGGKHEDEKELALSNSLNLPYFDKKQGGKGLWAREKIHPKYVFKKGKMSWRVSSFLATEKNLQD